MTELLIFIESFGNSLYLAFRNATSGSAEERIYRQILSAIEEAKKAVING